MIDVTDLVRLELDGLYGNEVIHEMNEIIKLYEAYEGPGQKWQLDKQDYTPTVKKTNYIKKLIKEESRFLFGKTPIFTVKDKDNDESIAAAAITEYINDILNKNLFKDKLIKGARDCFIGKRVAIKLHADTIAKAIRVMFVPSLEFVYEPFDDRVDELRKIIFFYSLNDTQIKSEQRIWKQKFEMIDGKCILNEGIYDGHGYLIESYFVNENLGLSGIPAYVIINDGLSGDLKGESDVKELLDNAINYNKLASEDIDTLIKGMNRIIYGVDVDSEDSKNFKIKAGSYWDVSTSPLADGKQASLGTIDTDFGYDARIENTLSRIKADMHETLNIPMINNSDMVGMMTSGKTMKALYWQLITRCEEKWNAWNPALTWLIEAIIEMSEVFNISKLPKIENKVIVVENQYPLQEDEDNEMTLDMQRVNAQVMSKKTFIKKWANVTDDVAEEELKQIQLEKQMLEDSIGQFETNFEDEE